MENEKNKECGCNHEDAACTCEHDSDDCQCQHDHENCGCEHEHHDGCDCDHEHHHGKCGCHHDEESEYCDGDEVETITLVDQETNEEFEVVVLFSTELDGKSLSYVCHGDFEDESKPLDVFVLEEAEEHQFQAVDIDNDPRGAKLREIYEEWQASMDGADSDPDTEVDFL